VAIVAVDLIAPRRQQLLMPVATSDGQCFDGVGVRPGEQRRVRNRRTDFCHQTAHTLTTEHGLVAVEDLRVKHMTASARGTDVNTGGLLLTAGTALTLAGVEAHSVVLAGAGTILSGIGFGASALASFGTLARIAAPAERGELFAFACVSAYLAFSLPAVLAGVASAAVGLRSTALVYGLGVVAFSLAALAAQRTRTAWRRQAEASYDVSPRPLVAPVVRRAADADSDLVGLCDAASACCRYGAA